MQVSLELSGHPKANVQRVILRDSTIVGRSQACGLQIASGSVSRKHCEIRIKESGVSVLDLGSSNGTFVDTERIPAGEERALPTGCRLNIGGVRFIVSYGEQPIDDTLMPANLGHQESREAGITDTSAEMSEEQEAKPELSANETFAEDEPLLADEPILETDESSLPSSDSEDILGAGDDSDFDIALALDDDAGPAVSTPADEEPVSPETVAADHVSSTVSDDDEPIIELDEDQALAFLNDDEERSK